MDVADMASKEMKLKRLKTEEDTFNARRSDWNKGKVSENGAYTCNKCKSSKTSYFQLQIRGADEPMTTFITCNSCSHQWKHN